MGRARLLTERRAGWIVFHRPHRIELRRRKERGRLGIAGAVRQLRRLPRHVRSAKQESHGPAHMDEPSLLADFRLADLRLLFGTDGRLLRSEESIGATAHPMEPADRQYRNCKLQRWSRCG